MECVHLDLFNDLHNILVFKDMLLAHSLRPMLGARTPNERILKLLEYPLQYAAAIIRKR